MGTLHPPIESADVRATLGGIRLRDSLTPEDALPPGTISSGVIRSYLGAGARALRYRAIEAEPCRHTLVYLHGIESHGAWFLPAAAALRERGCTTYLVDRRGSGLNRDVAPGDAPSATTLLEDVARFRDHLGDPPLHLVGLSWGGKLATAAAIDRPRRLRGLVLVTPGIVSRLRPTLGAATKAALGLVATLGRNRVELPIEPEMFSARPDALAFIRRDPWRTRSVTSRFLLASHVLGRRIAHGAESIEAPILLCLAGKDPIVDDGAVLARLRPAPRLRVRLFPNAIHSLQFDEQGELVREIVSFLDATEGEPC